MDVNDYFKKYLKRDACESIMVAIIFLIIGALITANPQGIVLTFSYIIGTIFTLVGIAKIISYFVMNGNEDFLNYDLVFGIIAIISGIIFITQSAMISTLFRIMIAIWLIYSALIRGTTAMKLKRFEVNTWWFALISAILMGIVGFYIISSPGILVASLGILMIVYAIMDLINGILFIIDVNKL